MGIAVILRYAGHAGPGMYLRYFWYRCEEYTPSTLDTYPFLNPLQHVNTVTMSELITTFSAYIVLIL